MIYIYPFPSLDLYSCHFFSPDSKRHFPSPTSSPIKNHPVFQSHNFLRYLPVHLTGSHPTFNSYSIWFILFS